LGAYVYSSVIITGTEEPQRTTAGYVTDDLFNILGVHASIGRGIVPGDADDRSERVVVLGHGLWRRSFGADPTIVGQTISLDKRPHTVIGIMPPAFNFPFGGVSMWIPYRVNANAERGVGSLLGVGRLKPGVTVAMAHAEISTIANRLKLEYPETNAEKGARVVGLREGLIFFFDILRLMFLTLAAAVALVLLIGCANVANLVLAWGAAREREIAIRTAMGAGRGRIVRQLLTENALLALMAGALGTTIAILAVRPVTAIMPEDLWRAGNIAVDGSALLFALVVSLGTVFIFGLLPALQSTRANVANTLKESGRSGSESARGRRLSNVLVVGEIGLAMFLLIGAGLLVKSVRSMSRMDLGLVADQVLTASLTLPRADYQNDADVLTFVTNTLAQLNAASIIENAAAVYPLPMNFESMGTNFTVDGQSEEPDELQPASAHWATPDYFRAMSIPLLAGRVFTDQDIVHAPPVVVINRALAERHFPGLDPIGRRMTIRDTPSEPRTATVIGVVGNVVQGGLYEAFGPQVYHPFLQNPSRGFYLVLSAETEPSTAIPTLRSVIRTADASLPISSVRAMNDVVNESLGPFQGVAAVLTLLAAGALALAGGGIYGVIAYSVSRRVHEFGIRAALGASDRNVIRLVVAQGAKLTAFGIGIGVTLAFATTRVIESVLFGVASADVTTFVGIPALLAVVALLASYIPARRATRVDPMEALRGE
ncbi:MAG: ABC transporter permease, partial [Gemmatimonadales bacterium]